MFAKKYKFLGEHKTFIPNLNLLIDNIICKK